MKLAIVIKGSQNSGKTSTIKHFIGKQTGRKLRFMKKGWQRIFLNESFKCLRLTIYCLPASPSESNPNKTISELLKGKTPSAIIVAEQRGGKNYDNTIEFLKEHGYTLKCYRITDTTDRTPWTKFDNTNKNEKLDQRTEQIVRDIKDFIRMHSIV